jgi:hypothetical protein
LSNQALRSIRQDGFLFGVFLVGLGSITMPCGSEHMKKLDSMLDALFAPKKDQEVMGSPPLNKDCNPFSDKKDSEREELRTGALSKKE